MNTHACTDLCAHTIAIDGPVVYGVLAEIRDERAAQDAKWGGQSHPDGTPGLVSAAMAESAKVQCQWAAADGRLTWRHILAKEFFKALAEDDPAKLRAELIQAAAVAVAWVEAIDRRTEATR